MKPRCRCGCGEEVRAWYKPGHDRRHVERYIAWFKSAPETRNSRESIDKNARESLSPSLFAHYEERTSSLRNQA